MALTKEDIEQITLAVMTAVKASDKAHREDHDFIRILRAREEAKQKLYSAVITHISKWGAVGLISSIGLCIWLVFKQKILGA